MLTLTQFSRKINLENHHLYVLAKLLPLPKTCMPVRAGAKKFYDDDALHSWHEKSLEIKSRPVPAKFNSMDDAPKDEPIILDIGDPWPVVGHWNEAGQEWCYANLQASRMENGDIDIWFENDQEEKPRGWLPMPEVSHAKR